MTTERINLQNTPAGVSTTVEPVVFGSGDNHLRGLLFRPSSVYGPLPGIVVTGSWTSIKEQMSGTYARELALRGFATLAFDPAGWGESDGSPRYVEDPARKTADIVAAIEFLASRADVDADRLFGLGICASAGYMAAVAANDGLLARLALVAPWLHDPEIARAIYGGAKTVEKLIAASDAGDCVIPSASSTDERSVMYRAPYYTEEDRGLIPQYDNKFNMRTWRPWLTYDALASAAHLDIPLLLVGSPSMALPAGVEAFEARMAIKPARLWLGEDVTQFDFYDRRDVVTASSDAVADHFAR